MEKFPVPLVCITLENVIDDPDTVEGFMQSDLSAVEECIPIIMRRMLGPAASRAELSPERLTTNMLLRVLQVFWTPTDEKDFSIRRDKMLRHAVELGASYLVPYLLELLPPPPPYGDYPLVRIMNIAATNPDLNVAMDMVRIIQRVVGGIGLGGRREIWNGLLNSAAAYGNANIVDFVIDKTTRDGKSTLTREALTAALNIASNSHPELFQVRANEYERLTGTLIRSGADASYRDYQAMRIAAKHGNIGMVRALIQTTPKGAIVRAIIDAAMNGQNSVVQLLINSDIDPNLATGQLPYLYGLPGHLNAVKMIQASVQQLEDKPEIQEALRKIDEILIEARKWPSS